MNFDFSEDQKLLQKTARDFLEEHSPLSVCREILESDQPYSHPRQMARSTGASP